MPTHNMRFGVMAAVTRENGSANLQVTASQEVQWKRWTARVDSETRFEK